jgi:ABC-2 type transport system permease protein
MLWYKGWLETRLKLLVTLGMVCFLTGLQHLMRPAGTNTVYSVPFLSAPFLAFLVFMMLSGAGVITQAPLQAMKGLHGSTLYTLALPVSRFRLLAVRSLIGWLEASGVLIVLTCGAWFLSPGFRSTTTLVVMFEQLGTVVACGSLIYFFSVLLATFLEDQWRVVGSMFAWTALSWLSLNKLIPASVDIVSAMQNGSPLFTHTVPWGAIKFSLATSAAFFLASMRVVEAREY